VGEEGTRVGVSPSSGAGAPDPAVVAMLEARTAALVGATPRPGTLGLRALVELERSPSVGAIHLVNPRRAGERVRDRTVLSSLEDIDDPVDLVLFAVGDEHLEDAISSAARHGDRSGVVFSSAAGAAHDGTARRDRIAAIARDAGMALCGGGCMGFVSQTVRAIGYLEHAPLPAGPIALVTHSGSVFSALLRAERPFGWTLAVSSGQELVTTTAAYLEYALSQPGTGILALVLETLREPERAFAALERARDAGIPVVALTVGTSHGGGAMVAAHSGALAGSDGAWEALCDRYGVLRVHDLEELCDTVELLLSGRRPPGRGRGAAGRGIAAVLDSGAERALLMDVADACGVPFADIAASTRTALEGVLDPGLVAENPLDVWGRGRDTEELFTDALVALARDDAVDAVALAVDLVSEFDGDESYPASVVAAWNRTEKPLCVLSHVPSALDRASAHKLRAQGIPVLEGTRSGLLALRHLLELRDQAARPVTAPRPLDAARRDRWRARLGRDVFGPGDAAALLADYGIPAPPAVAVANRTEAVAAAGDLGYPVVLKTATPGLAHKSDVGGVRLGLASPGEVDAAYLDLAGRLGPLVTVTPMAPPGVELALGLVRDPMLGPLVVVGAGGTLVDLVADRAVALPPLGVHDARRMLGRLRARRLLDGYRDVPAADLEAVLRSIQSMSDVAVELGDVLRALEVNPLRCTAEGVLALDVLVET